MPLSVIPALLVSNILNSNLLGMKFFRAVYFIPSVAAVVGVSLIWQWMYNAAVGWINYAITRGVEEFAQRANRAWHRRSPGPLAIQRRHGIAVDRR